MDTAERRPQLPALDFLETEKTRIKEDPYQSRAGPVAPPLSIGSITSPASRYPAGLSPAPLGHSYNNTPATPYSASWHTSTGIKTPPGSRRSSGDDKEDAKQNTRQSLPSISDVLAHEHTSAYSAPQPSSLRSSTPAHHQTAVKSSPSPRSGRPFATESHHTSQKPFAGSYPTYRSEQTHDAIRPPLDVLRHAHTPVQGPPPTSYPPLNPPAPTSAPNPVYPRSQDSSGVTEQQHGPPPTPNGPSNLTYGYTPYQARFANAPPQGVSSGPLYQPSTTLGAPSAWKPSEGSRHLEERPPGQVHFGESVKRQFELYDFEVALNEVAHTSGALADFARRYGDQMHRSQPAGPLLAGSLPSVVEIEDMILKSRVQHESLIKIQDLTRTQQAAFEQQAAERQQSKAFNDQPAGQPDGLHTVIEDSKTFTYVGGDTKKRRGRAAPPGRCHSCNRAETPEWRRGPDGARTLCNACGLHYAKLTRKNNYAKQTAALGSSNLRPKENPS